MDLIEEIKREVRILDLVSKLGLQVVKHGHHSFVKSIYKEERTPSLQIYPETDSYFCRATYQGGDVICFYEDFYGLDRKQAVRELAKLYNISKENVELTTRRPDQLQIGNQQNDNKKSDIFSCMSEIEKETYYERLGITDNEADAIKEIKLMRLEKNTEIFTEFYAYCTYKGFNDAALKYLTVDRKFTPEVIKTFKLFFINNYSEVNQHMKKVFKLQDLQRSGLYNRKDNGEGNLIFFQHRLIIPYLFNKKIVYLRGRYFDQQNNIKTDFGKYIGLADDALKLNQPKRFFNIDVTRNMLKNERLYITEGEFDAIALESIGVNAVGIPGAGNIPETKQFKRLLDFKIILCVDNDTAGNKLLTGKYQDRNGIERYSDVNLKQIFASLNKQFFIKRLPVKDANDFIKQYGD